MDKIENLLRSNEYPGRGIIIGKSSDGKYAVTAYFIMGRSENSRNRVFIADGDGLKTKAYDESKVSDPSLIIYSPVRVIGDYLIVTNGDQTDTIYDGLKNGKGMSESLLTRKFEPDEPNYTPRISGLLDFSNGYKFTLSILKSDDGNGESCQRIYYNYDEPVNGEGYFIHTYIGNGNPLPSFKGEPEKIEISQNIDDFTGTIWNSLNESNKISLFVRYINLENKKADTRILNKNK